MVLCHGAAGCGFYSIDTDGPRMLHTLRVPLPPPGWGYPCLSRRFFQLPPESKGATREGMVKRKAQRNRREGVLLYQFAQEHWKKELLKQTSQYRRQQQQQHSQPSEPQRRILDTTSRDME
eukprot:Sspe_Gene.45956::Locus_22830_Transcript_1_1_Confidence_1.000_Length_1747::g.45956::m.45956